MWLINVQCDFIEARKSGIIVVYENNQPRFIVDVALPGEIRTSEKVENYQELRQGIVKIWKIGELMVGFVQVYQQA